MVHCEDANPIIQCKTCFKFGHTSKICRKATSEENPQSTHTCWHCAEEHSSSSCPNKKSPKVCVNCKASNEKHNTKHNLNHPPTSNKCPIYRAFVLIKVIKLIIKIFHQFSVSF